MSILIPESLCLSSSPFASMGYSSLLKQMQSCLSFSLTVNTDGGVFGTMHYVSVPSSLTIALFFHCQFSHMPNISFPRLCRCANQTLCGYYYDIEVCPVRNETRTLRGSFVIGLNFSQICRKKCRETENIAHQ